jgi:hypothetical protein
MSTTRDAPNAARNNGASYQPPHCVNGAVITVSSIPCASTSSDKARLLGVRMSAADRFEAWLISLWAPTGVLGRRLGAYATQLIVLAPSLCILMMGGLVFGFSSLYPVLYDLGVFQDACGAHAQCEDTTRQCCDAQFERYTLLSSVALFAADGTFALYGELMDRRGPRDCFIVGMALCAFGFFVLGANAYAHLDALWYVGFVGLGVAGPGVFMGCLSLGQKYPRLEPVITAFAASMFDSSSIVFLLFQLLYLQAGLGLGAIALLWCAPRVPSRLSQPGA